jgi:hypothetical protein
MEEVDKDLIDKRVHKRQPTKRSTFRRGINRIRNSYGDIEIINAKASAWYTTYVVNPQLDCEKFNSKF